MARTLPTEPFPLAPKCIDLIQYQILFSSVSFSISASIFTVELRLNFLSHTVPDQFGIGCVGPKSLSVVLKLNFYSEN